MPLFYAFRIPRGSGLLHSFCGIETIIFFHHCFVQSVSPRFLALVFHNAGYVLLLRKGRCPVYSTWSYSLPEEMEVKCGPPGTIIATMILYWWALLRMLFAPEIPKRSKSVFLPTLPCRIFYQHPLSVTPYEITTFRLNLLYFTYYPLPSLL